MKSDSTYCLTAASEATDRKASGEVPIHNAYAAATNTNAAPHATVTHRRRYRAAGRAATKKRARSAMKFDRAPVKRVLACTRVADRDADRPPSGATERMKDRWAEVAW